MMFSLAKFILAIDRLNHVIGSTVSWLALGIVVVQFLVVLFRYIFGVGSIFAQELIVYQHAALFMLGAGYTLLHNGHVRLDIFYRHASARIKNIINFLGSLVFLLPMATVIAFYSWPYVSQSWRVLEGSKETSGIQAVFVLKTIILVFAFLLFLQGLALMLRSLCALRGHSIPAFPGTAIPRT